MIVALLTVMIRNLKTIDNSRALISAPPPLLGIPSEVRSFP